MFCVTPRQRYNHYLETDVYKRTRDACEALGLSMSEYVNDLLGENLPLLEEAAKAKSLAAAEFNRASFEDVLLKKLLELVAELQAARTENR
jgi:hypothetical protein